MQHPPRTGQPTDPAKRLLDEAFAIQRPTSYRDDTPLPAIGTTPPVTQPGRPPMSQKATDVSSVMLAAGVATVPPGLIAIGILVASEHADPTILGMICAAPAALAIPILAVARLARRAREVVEAAPTPVHQHFHADVTIDQRSINSRTRGVIANTRNQG